AGPPRPIMPLTNVFLGIEPIGLVAAEGSGLGGLLCPEPGANFRRNVLILAIVVRQCRRTSQKPRKEQTNHGALLERSGITGNAHARNASAPRVPAVSKACRR